MAPLPWLTTTFFSITLLPALYVLYKHRRHGLLGWLYVFNFCILRIVGNVMQIKADNSATYSPASIMIVNSTGITPLLLAGAGILHEA
jgi:hypothetical protein